MKKKLQIKYPWQQLEKGQGFFVPCLDPEAVIQDGLRKAIGARKLHAKARVGVKDGKLGVWFHL